MDIIEINLGQPVEIQWAFNNVQKTTLKTYRITNNINDPVYENSDEIIYVVLESELIVAREDTRIISPSQNTIYEITAENFFNKKVVNSIQVKILEQPTYDFLSVYKGVPGDSITINGTNFPLNPFDIDVKFLGLNNTYVTAVITSNDQNTITCNVPNNVLSGPITIDFSNTTLITDDFIIDRIDSLIVTNNNLPNLYNNHIEGTSFVHNDLIFVFAGGNNYLDIYDPSTNILNSAESSALFRSGFPICTKYNDFVYVFGGHDQYNNTQKYIEKFDLRSLSWSVIDTGVYFPFDKNGTNRSGATIGNKLYIFVDEETLVFNLDTEQFETSLSALPKTPLLSKSISFDNYIYIFGFDSGAFIYKFDPNTDTFLDVTPTDITDYIIINTPNQTTVNLNFSVDSNTKIFKNNTIQQKDIDYIVSSPTQIEFLNPLNINDIITISYINFQRCDLALLNNRIIITGSELNETLIKVFNPQTDTFDSIGINNLPINCKKKNHTSQVVKGQLYLLGGNSNILVRITPILV